MFGRRKNPFGGSPAAPPPPPGKEPFPVDKMDRALEAAIRLFTRVLDGAGTDSGYLGLRGEPVPDDVSGLIANCTTYRADDDGAQTYLLLAVTSDFNQFDYMPHFRFWFVLNSTGICESPHCVETLPTLAPGQLPGPLVDAWLLRRWIAFMPSAVSAFRAGTAAQGEYFGELGAALGEVVSAVPPEWREPLGLRDRCMKFGSGFPVGVGCALDAQVPRMNGLPMTPSIANALTEHLGKLQPEGLNERLRA